MVGIKLMLCVISINVMTYHCLPYYEETLTLDERYKTTDKYNYPHNSEIENSKTFDGIFLTETQLENQLDKIGRLRENYFMSKDVPLNGESLLNHDGDSCCPTHFSHYINTTMENIYGEMRPIVHFPPRYQYIPHGSCVETTTSNCNGKCFIEPIPLSLLTWDYEENFFVFEVFMVPGYCSCKSVYNSRTSK